MGHVGVSPSPPTSGMVSDLIDLIELIFFPNWPKLSTTGELLQLRALKQPIIKMFHENVIRKQAGL